MPFDYILAKSEKKRRREEMQARVEFEPTIDFKIGDRTVGTDGQVAVPGIQANRLTARTCCLAFLAFIG